MTLLQNIICILIGIILWYQGFYMYMVNPTKLKHDIVTSLKLCIVRVILGFCGAFMVGFYITNIIIGT
jgi:hypothetical protein